MERLLSTVATADPEGLKRCLRGAGRSHPTPSCSALCLGKALTFWKADQLCPLLARSPEPGFLLAPTNAICWLFPTVPRCSEARYPAPKFQDVVLGRVERAPAGSSPRRHEPMGCTQHGVFKQKHAKEAHMLISWQNVKPEACGHPAPSFLGTTAQFPTS